MKHINKKIFSVVLAVAIMFTAFGTYMAGIDKVNAAQNPKYVAKMNYKEGDTNNNAIRHNIASADIEAGKTYTFVCNYYVDSEQEAVASVHFTSNAGWSVASTNTGTKNIKTALELKLSHTATENDKDLAVRIENSSGGDVYLWNIKLYKDGIEVTSFRNADFTEENGSWYGWQMTNYNNNTYIDTVDENTGAIAATEHTILSYEDCLDFLPDYTTLPDCTWDGATKTLSFSGEMEFDLSTITDYQLYQRGKAFVGWKNQAGQYLEPEMLNGYTFKEGEVLTADYIDYNSTATVDFAIHSEEMRTDGELGLRYVVELSNNLKDNLPGAGEYGTIVLPTEILDANSWADLTYDGEYTYNGTPYKTSVVKATKVYQTLADRIYYTLCITNIDEKKYDRQYMVKGYIKYTDYNGVEQILYTDYASTNPYLVSSDQLSESELSDEETSVLEGITQKVETKYKEQRKEWEAGAIDFVGTSGDSTGWIYQLANGIRVREVNIATGKGGEEVEIMHLSDLHYNYLNALDFAEANPTLLSTYEKRTWGKDGAFAPVARKLLTYAQAADQVVITGDVLDYLSHGTVEMMNREIWDKYPNTMIALGNHEPVQQMQGTVAETLSGNARMQWIESVWKHNAYYSSKLVGNKVLVVQLHNGENKFLNSQIEKLRSDINDAKTNGYIVLLFMHETLSTGNSEDTNVAAIRSEATDAGNQGDSKARDFYSMNSSTTGNVINIHPDIDDATKQVYDLITNNAEVIKGVFNGHVHSSYYTEIVAKTSTGDDAIIPQYTISSGAFDNGYAIKIKVN